jgi:hypothetical protein
VSDLLDRLRQYALPDPNDEREVLHAPLLREAADELARLRAENADLRERNESLAKRLMLVPEDPEVWADAERYRWLCAGDGTDPVPVRMLYRAESSKDELDAAIDALRNHSEPVHNKPPEERALARLLLNPDLARQSF